LLGLGLLVAVGAAACIGASTNTCNEVRESEDPQSNMHVLTDDGYQYLTHPPTSGPHASGPTPSGVLDTPLAEAVQVRILEAGGVVVQHRDQLTSSDAGALSVLDVVAAPDPNLDNAFVVTAWTWKLSCPSLAVDEITQFAQQRRTSAPGVD